MEVSKFAAGKSKYLNLGAKQQEAVKSLLKGAVSRGEDSFVRLQDVTLDELHEASQALKPNLVVPKRIARGLKRLEAMHASFSNRYAPELPVSEKSHITEFLLKNPKAYILDNVGGVPKNIIPQSLGRVEVQKGFDNFK